MNPSCESTKKIDQKWAKIQYFGGLSQRFLPLAETKISANMSRITSMGELIEMVQYTSDESVPTPDVVNDNYCMEMVSDVLTAL